MISSEKTWGVGDALVTPELFTRHFEDVRSLRETSHDSFDWRPKHVGEIITLAKDYRHSFVERVVTETNRPKKFKGTDQGTLEFKFSHILSQYSKLFCLCILITWHES